MKKFSALTLALVLTLGMLVSCKNKSEAKEKEAVKHEHNGSNGEHPPKHDRERKGPPPGGNHSPEQTKTLEEIGGYKIDETATDFKLKNIDGNLFSLSSIENAKGYIVVFTCNECPFAKMYEDRLVALHKKYAPQGFSVVAINPNVSANSDKESFEAMQKRAKEKAFPFVYLADENQEVFPKYGAVRTPHVFLLDAERKVQYIGTIDDNARSASGVKTKYVEDAINALLKGEKPETNYTKAIGCPVKPVKA
ncbi:thioredoxin family protein [Neotamlana laminarinivorans]|uniref:Thioredoxin family protein n=1 Tax=Neotamlana laminarinivorans TaxID=2883124 RepID=A0A9X1HY71_9FLAO|nr:thioredoxin family protein [Tamlana laminarinivorans]MCB4797766.1 thioredoxin family protein [Tamlana laminarinivorans]